MLELNNKNFDSAIKNNKYILVLFYAHWCPHCTNMMSEYKNFADTNTSDVKIACIDCALEENKGICNLNNIESYPTMKLFLNGLENDFMPEKRTADSMQKKLNEMLTK